MVKINLPVVWTTPRLIGFQRADGTTAFVPRGDVVENEDLASAEDDHLYCAEETVVDRFFLR